MALFGTKDRQAENLRATERMVESVIRELNLDPKENRLKTGGDGPAWGLMKGSAEVFIFVNPGDPGEHENHIQVISPVMKLPPDPALQLKLFHRLLSLNVQGLIGVAFGLKGDTVVLTTDRTTTGLDQSEVKDMVLRIGYYADTYDDALVSQFGGQRHTD